MIRQVTGKTFPNLNQEKGSYNPFSWFIALNEIDEKEFPNIFAEVRDYETAKKASVYIHEARHNLDHLGTLWGQQNLLKYSKAINARLSNNPAAFQEILPVMKETYQWYYDQYFTVHYSKAIYNGPQDVWKWATSIGLKFGLNGELDQQTPILFIKFSKPTDQPLVRVPLSIAALLEVNAVYDQYHHLVQYINTLEPLQRTAKHEELSQYLFQNLLYNQYSAVYNSIVHLTANILNLSEFLSALKISSAISTLALNLSPELVNLIPLPKQTTEELDDRCRSMMNNMDYGFIFYALLCNYQTKFDPKIGYKLEDVLETNALPPITEVIQITRNELNAKKLEYSGLSCLRSHFERGLFKGTKILEARGLDGMNFPTLRFIKEKIFVPDVICGDVMFDSIEFDFDELVRIPPRKLSPLQRYFFSEIITEKLEEFFAIRGL